MFIENNGRKYFLSVNWSIDKANKQLIKHF